jgi:hypothetical protein
MTLAAHLAVQAVTPMQRYYDSLVAAGRRPHRCAQPALPPLDQNTLASLRLDQLRVAVRANLVSFPSAVPTFERHDRPDLQWKIVQLYFVLGWGCETIAVRFGLVHQRVSQILKTWKRRAIETGYIQYIPPFEPLPMPAANATVAIPQLPAFVVIPPQAPPPVPLRVSSEISTY